MSASPFPTWTPHVKSHPFSENFRGLLSSALTYLETRWQLVELEARQALRLGMRVIILALFAATCAFVAYASGVVALTLWMAHAWWHGEVMPAAACMAGIHLLLGVIAVGTMIWSTRSQQLFRDTRKEFEEDKRWLHLQTTTSKS